MNYGQLKSHVSDWLNRDDLSVIVPTWLQLAQTQIERANTFNYMLTLDSTLTATAGYITLPASFKEPSFFRVTANSKKYTLEQMDEKAIYEAYPESSDTGIPEAYAIAVNATKFLLRPLPDTTYTYDLGYYAYSATLSADADTNWLTNNAPDVLMYTALMMSAPYLEEDARIETWAALLKASLDAVKKLDTRMRFGGSSLYVHPETTII